MEAIPFIWLLQVPVDRENDQGGLCLQEGGRQEASSGVRTGANFGLSDSIGVDSDPKVHVLKPVFVTLFGNRGLWERNEVKMRSYQIRKKVGSLSVMSNSL